MDPTCAFARGFNCAYAPTSTRPGLNTVVSADYDDQLEQEMSPMTTFSSTNSRVGLVALRADRTGEASQTGMRHISGGILVLRTHTRTHIHAERRRLR